MKTNKIFEPKVRHSFYAVIISVMAMCIADSVCIFFLSHPHPTVVQVLALSVGYSLRPLVALFTYFIVMRRRTTYHIIMWIPEIINVIIVFTALFSPIAFSYNDNNQFVRGPLGFMPHAVSMFYLLMIFLASVRMSKELAFSEVVLLMALAVILVAAVILDMFLRSWLTVPTASVALTFYYIYFHSQAQMRDPLTNVYNRKAFYMDANKFRKEICGLVGFDLNDLKVINDTQGHAAGDKALITITEVIKAYLPRKCRLYRTGGDEFVVMCRRASHDTLEKFIDNVKVNMTATAYRCAAGLAYSEESADIDTLYKTADQMMYQDKTKMKSGRCYREQART